MRAKCASASSTVRPRSGRDLAGPRCLMMCNEMVYYTEVTVITLDGGGERLGGCGGVCGCLSFTGELTHRVRGLVYVARHMQPPRRAGLRGSCTGRGETWGEALAGPGWRRWQRLHGCGSSHAYIHTGQMLQIQNPAGTAQAVHVAAIMCGCCTAVGASRPHRRVGRCLEHPAAAAARATPRHHALLTRLVCQLWRWQPPGVRDGAGGVSWGTQAMWHAGPRLAQPLQRRDTKALWSPGRSTSQNCDAPSRLHRGRNGPVSSQSKGIQTCRPSPVDRIKIHKNFASRQGMVFALPRHPPERQNDCARRPARRAEAVEGPGGAGPQARPRRRSRRM